MQKVNNKLPTYLLNIKLILYITRAQRVPIIMLVLLVWLVCVCVCVCVCYTII